LLELLRLISVEKDYTFRDRADGQLMAGWQRGDPAAFGALVRRWEGPIARFLTRLLGPAAALDDLCQEVFIRVCEAGARYREAGAFSTWLYRIALNVARDSGRKRRRTMLSLQDQAIPMAQSCPVAEFERRETAQLVAEAVAELPEPLRLVLVLHHYEELNFEQIASLTGTPASTLKSRFAVALARLRTRLQQLGCDLEETIR
jgi:RNA polymerase sigma-70 factor, ECF subfamily